MSSFPEKPNLLPIITALTARDLRTLVQPGDAGLSGSAIASLADGADVRTLWPPGLQAACRARLVRRLTDDADEYGPDYEPAGFELVGPVDEAELAEARIIIAASMRPSAAETVTRELTRLRFATASREFSPAEMAMIGSIYAEELGRYPEDIVTRVCRDWPKRQKFWPALAELVEPAERLMVERRSLAEALARGPAKPPEPDPYEEERQRAIEAQKQRWAEAAAHRAAHPELMGGYEEQKRPPVSPLFYELTAPTRWSEE